MGRRPKVTREEVLQAARETFAERGFEGATLAAIAARLDVSPAALLRHAASKEELFSAAMKSRPFELPPQVTSLKDADTGEDPRVVLRRFAEGFVPFLEGRLDEQIAHWMRSKSLEDGRGFPLPFDPEDRPNPPQRVLALLEAYLRRATEAGRLQVSDPLAAALVFLGSLQSYVMLHRVVRILEPPLPLDRYLDAVLEIWTRGALMPGDSGHGSTES